MIRQSDLVLGAIAWGCAALLVVFFLTGIGMTAAAQTRLGRAVAAFVWLICAILFVFTVTITAQALLT